MAEFCAGRLDDFPPNSTTVLMANGREIGIVRLGDDFRAYLNRCPHAGGPVCQGMQMPRVEEVLDDAKRSLGFRFSDQQINLVCPWHGYEFDAMTGVHQGSSSVKLRAYPVRIDGDTVYVEL